MKQNKILCLIDYSYFSYYVIFGAVKKFQTRCPEEASELIKSPEETPQDNLPNLLVSDNFRRELKKSFINRCEAVDWILKDKLQNVLDIAEKVDYVAVMDDNLGNSFRKEIYPEYKSNRKLQKKAYDISAIKHYIDDVICPELVEKGKFVFKKLKVEGAEGDDIIACIVRNFNDDYVEKVLIASDHDFLQLGGMVKQFDLAGRETTEKIKVKKEDIYLDGNMSLKIKILAGDNSDNIPPIMERVGKVKAWKLANDEKALKKLLSENQSAANQYALNEKIIDFEKIPKELEEKIVETARPILEKQDEERSLSDKMMDSVFVIE